MTRTQADKAFRILDEEGEFARIIKTERADDCGGYIVEGDGRVYYHLWEVTDPLPYETAYGPYNDADSGL